MSYKPYSMSIKIWKVKNEWIDRKEFMRRWKDGITKVTPLQQTKVTLLSFVPLLVGMVWGITVSAINKQWWLVVTLAGAVGISGMQVFSTYQKYIILERIERRLKTNE